MMMLNPRTVYYLSKTQWKAGETSSDFLVREIQESPKTVVPLCLTAFQNLKVRIYCKDTVHFRHVL